MRKSYAFLPLALLVMSSVTLTSCEKLFNKSPEIEDQEFTIKENSPEGTVIGTIVASDKSGQELTFKIVDGDDDEIFALEEKTGVLTVNDPLLLDYERSANITIKVEVKDEFDKWNEGEVTINLEDVKPTTDQLLSYYRFNGNGNDETGYSNATVSNCSYTVDQTFGNHAVLSLSGIGYADLNKGFDYSSKSISIWFKVPSITSTMQVIYSSDHESYQYGLSAMTVQTIEGVDVMEYNLSGHKVYVPIIENKWYNAIAVLNSTAYSFYLNGEPVGSGSISSYYRSDIGYPNSLIGVSRNFDRTISGNIAEARFYTKALSAEEVHIIYTETER